MGDCEAGERMLVGDGDEVGRHVLVDSVVKVDARVALAAVQTSRQWDGKFTDETVV